MPFSESRLMMVMDGSAALDGAGWLGESGRDIHMPTTSTPLWIARIPKGMSLARLGGMPVLRISSTRAFFSSSRTSCFLSRRVIHHNLTTPARKTAAIAAPRT